MGLFGQKRYKNGKNTAGPHPKVHKNTIETHSDRFQPYIGSKNRVRAHYTQIDQKMSPP